MDSESGRLYELHNAFRAVVKEFYAQHRNNLIYYCRVGSRVYYEKTRDGGYTMNTDIVIKVDDTGFYCGDECIPFSSLRGVENKELFGDDSMNYLV